MPNEMVEVFKTNVQEVDAANGLIQQLLDRFQADKISFDLEDCDKVLRVEGKPFCPNELIDLMTAQGYECEVLV